jgi:hypothetical protein
MTWCTDCREPSQAFRFRKVLTVCAWNAVCLLMASSTAWGLEFREVRWGFNGGIKRHEFNLCTIELINPTSEPFQGPIELRPTRSIYTEVPLVEPDVFIGAGETRAIQFLPFVGSDNPDWEVRWGNGPKQRQELPRPSRELAKPVAVQFLTPQSVSSPIRGIEGFSEFDFPIGAPGTEVLGVVVLDHVPRWDELRRRAFRDWIGQGGELYLLNDRDGKRLEFPAPLEELNVAADHFQVGQGSVIRHGLIGDAAEIPELYAHIATAPVTDSNGNGNGNWNVNYNDPRASGLSQLFQNMQAQVRPNHNWPLIFFLAVIYLLVLFPGIWIFSRKRGDFRVTYLAILGTVALFSFLYAEIGKRGYDESTGLQEMIIAEPLGNQRLLVRSYANLFVTEGGEYPIAPRGEVAVLTLDTGGHEAARFSGSASILSRPKAGLIADIPPFSSCSFQTHSVMTTESDYSLGVDQFTAEKGNLQVKARVGASFPAEVKVYMVTDTNSALQLTRDGDLWSGTGTPTPANLFFPATQHYGWSRETPDQITQNLLANLVQIATRNPIRQETQYGYQPETPTPATPNPTRGYLVAVCDAPSEFLTKEFGASGKAVFISRAEPQPATPTKTP